MFLYVYATCMLFVVISTQDLKNGDSCITPNGENATCIPIDSCSVIKKALTYLNEEAVEFAKRSQCGYEDDTGALVCCGTVGRVTTPAPVQVSTTPKPNIINDLPPANPIDNQLLPDLTLCGLQISKTSKNNGNKPSRGEHPWLAGLLYTQDNNDRTTDIKCSGALISSRYILTNAECVNIDGYTLKSAFLGSTEYSITDKTVHPYYSRKRGNNNIALLRLATKVPLNDIIRPICLPPNDYPTPVQHTEMEVSGWRLTQNEETSTAKTKGYITLMTYENCEKQIQNYTKYYYPARVCAKSTGSSHLCTRESGVPLVTLYARRPKTEEEQEEQYYLEGLVPETFGCDGPGKPGLYMRVSRYVTWIVNNMR